jgi:hypothetical protein
MRTPRSSSTRLRTEEISPRLMALMSNPSSGLQRLARLDCGQCFVADRHAARAPGVSAILDDPSGTGSFLAALEAKAEAVQVLIPHDSVPLIARGVGDDFRNGLGLEFHC